MTSLIEKIRAGEIKTDPWLTPKQVSAVLSSKNNWKKFPKSTKSIPNKSESYKQFIEKCKGSLYPIIKTKMNGNERHFAIYNEKKFIGSGTFGKVKLAQDIITHEFVAIKIFKEERHYKTEKEILIKLERFLGELKRKEKPTKNRGEKFYIAMEFYCGGNLKTVSFSECTLHEKIMFATKAIEELQKIHSKGIIHRDISAGNVIAYKVQGVPQVKVVDFGFSVISENGEIESEYKMGTKGYRPPEICDSKGKKYIYSVKGDIWSLGKLLKTKIFSDEEIFKPPVTLGEKLFHSYYKIGDVVDMLLNRMCAKDRLKRPDLDICKQPFQYTLNRMNEWSILPFFIETLRKVEPWFNSVPFTEAHGKSKGSLELTPLMKSVRCKKYEKKNLIRNSEKKFEECEVFEEPEKPKEESKKPYKAVR